MSYILSSKCRSELPVVPYGQKFHLIYFSCSQIQRSGNHSDELKKDPLLERNHDKHGKKFVGEMINMPIFI